MNKTMLIVTGAAAWLGGIATSMAALSCDVETCETDPQPSAIVRFWMDDGSVRRPVQANEVQYQVHATGGDPRRDLAAAPPPLQSGRCLDSGCTQWAVGQDQPGRIEIFAEACRESYSAEAIVELDELACHAQTQLVDIVVDGKGCPVGPERLPPYECEPAAHPSVHVLVAKRFDDYYMPVDVDMVWFEHEGQTYEARCLEVGGDCMAWIAGFEMEGPITVSTEYCDTVVSETVTVEPIPNSCHVQTEYVMLEVSTRGCLTADLPAQPPPQWPWDLVTKPPQDQPMDRPSDLTAPNRYPPPPTSPGGVAAPD